MGFLLDSSVKPVSSLAPIDFFCKRSAKDTPCAGGRPAGPTHAATSSSMSQVGGEGASSKDLEV